jgi:hypothetical protein
MGAGWKMGWGIKTMPTVAAAPAPLPSARAAPPAPVKSAVPPAAFDGAIPPKSHPVRFVNSQKGNARSIQSITNVPQDRMNWFSAFFDDPLISPDDEVRGRAAYFVALSLDSKKEWWAPQANCKAIWFAEALPYLSDDEAKATALDPATNLDKALELAHQRGLARQKAKKTLFGKIVKPLAIALNFIPGVGQVASAALVIGAKASGVK